LALGWEGSSTGRDVSDSNVLYTETIQLLDEAEQLGNNTDRNQEILGKVLARFCRYYCESPGRASRVCQVRQDSLRILSRLGARREMAYILRYLAHVGHTPLEARELYRRALATFEENNDDRGKAETFYRLGWVATQLGEYSEAERLYLDSLALTERLDRQEMVANCQLDLGYVYWALGNYRVAEQRCRESLSIFAQIGYPSQKALSLRYLARIAIALEDYATAKQYLQESLAIYQEVGLRGMNALASGELGYVAVLDNDLSEGRSLALKSLAICQELENRPGMIEPLVVLGMIAIRLGDLREAETYLQSALETALEEWVPAQALHSLLRMAGLFMAAGEKERALELSVLVQHHQAGWQWLRDRAASLIAELEAELPPAVVALAQARGPARDLEATVAELLTALAN
jgi:tetratricopeptide (TPR) repeat protein